METRGLEVSLSLKTCVLMLVVLSARAAVAQESEFRPWEPLGQIPVDQAGSGRRGYVLPGESTDVLDPAANQVSIHTVGANNFYLEDGNGVAISQRSEAHALAVEFRRGFKPARWPRFELGAQVQFIESDAGMLNGFIAGFEDMVHAPLRSRVTTLQPLGTSVARNGQLLYHTTGEGSGFGDVYLVAKAILRDSPAASRDTRVSARVAVNIAGAREFTAGNFAGAGLSIDKKMLDWLALHGDVRGTYVIDRASAWTLPLRRGVFAFSAGPEFRLTSNTSLNLQVDGSTTPYRETGSIGLDADYSDVAFGVNHRFTRGRRTFVAQFYARENMDMPFSVRWNTDPDFAVGFKLTIH
ncbi:MAG TPA: hypothetical protein VFP91_23200 [Vicinamibacterales bacterium]|nr:hypothetical protein [Vicinamibacterales bacterium]